MSNSNKNKTYFWVKHLLTCLLASFFWILIAMDIYGSEMDLGAAFFYSLISLPIAGMIGPPELSKKRGISNELN